MVKDSRFKPHILKHKTQIQHRDIADKHAGYLMLIHYCDHSGHGKLSEQWTYDCLDGIAILLVANTINIVQQHTITFEQKSLIVFFHKIIPVNCPNCKWEYRSKTYQKDGDSWTELLNESVAFKSEILDCNPTCDAKEEIVLGAECYLPIPSVAVELLNLVISDFSQSRKHRHIFCRFQKAEIQELSNYHRDLKNQYWAQVVVHNLRLVTNLSELVSHCVTVFTFDRLQFENFFKPIVWR